MSKHGLAAIAEGRTDLFRMDPRKIVVREGWNSRDFDLPENKDHVLGLAESIKTIGVREPLAGYLEDGQFILTNGESRLRAVLHLIETGCKIDAVPVQPEPRYASEAEHVLSQIVRNSGKPFTPIENARVYARLIEMGMSVKEIATKVGQTPERVAQVAKLDTVTPKVRRHIQTGKITSTLVQRIQSKAKDAKEVEAAVTEAIKNAEAEGKTKATPRHAAPKKAPAKEAKPRVNYRDLFEELMSFLETVVTEDGEATVMLFSIPADRAKAFQDAVKKTSTSKPKVETF
jgi:ParB/RepB/Spo0J family partition protein